VGKRTGKRTSREKATQNDHQNIVKPEKTNPQKNNEA
jgi:hypothetical protein